MSGPSISTDSFRHVTDKRVPTPTHRLITRLVAQFSTRKFGCRYFTNTHFTHPLFFLGTQATSRG